MTERKWYAFYSARSVSAGHGSTFYRHVDGSVVEVTCVVEDPLGSNYKWKDKVALGEVIRPAVAPGEPWDPPLGVSDDEELDDAELDYDGDDP